MSCKRPVLFLFVLLAAAGQITAQLQTPLTGVSEPFLIKPGSTFSASGGSKRGISSAANRIANDIREAQAIVLRHHFDAGQIKAESITKSALASMLHSLDPHSNFHDAAEWRELLDEQKSGYSGIGASIGEFTDGTTSDTYILSVVPGSPAANARLRFGDRIVSVNGRKTTGIGLSHVRDMIRGASGSNFTLAVERAATGRIEDLVLARNVVTQPSIPDAYIIRPGVGYIDLTEGFNYTTSDEFDRALRDLKRQGMRSLVLDLRWNGGGILDQAVKVAEKFLPAGTQILSQRGRGPLDARIYRSDTASAETMPLVVLVNDRTASASEIVAGAFQDHDRAVIVGEKTYGKGLVQTVIDLPGGSGLTLTTGRYLTPSGRSIQRDYSSVDIYDYYNQKTPSSGTGKAFFEARTITDRRVFGGDGIRPDEEVKANEMTIEQAKLLDPIFFFVRDLISGKIPGMESYNAALVFGTTMPLPKKIALSERMIAKFSRYLPGHGQIGINAGAAFTESAFISRQIRYCLVMGLKGPAAANRAIAVDDPQIVHAVDALPRAARLANLAKTIRHRK
ncbi:hypothetical protein BH20ACI2_BH20ACI2_23510 [soil metagenome]